MKKIIPYVSRDEVYKRLMANPMAASFWKLSEDEQNGYLDEVMKMQYVENAGKISQLIANQLYRNVLAIPLKIRLRYTTCRIPMIPITFFGASNLREFVK